MKHKKFFIALMVMELIEITSNVRIINADSTPPTARYTFSFSGNLEKQQEKTASNIFGINLMQQQQHVSFNPAGSIIITNLPGSFALNTTFTIRHSDVVLSDLFIIKNLKNFSILLGQMSIPFALEEKNIALAPFDGVSKFNLGSNNSIPEDVGILFTQKGIGSTLAWDTNYGGAQIGYYSNKFSDNLKGTDKSIFLGKLYTYFNGENCFWHIGLNTLEEQRKISQETNRWRNIEEISDYGLVPIKNSTRNGIEILFNYGVMSLQTEFQLAQITIGAFTNEKFSAKIKSLGGFYTQLNINLTGEINKYKGNGQLLPIDVLHPLGQGGIGAVSLALRFSHNDLQGNQTAVFDYGRHQSYEMSLNWIPINNFKITLQHSQRKDSFDKAEAIAINHYKSKTSYSITKLWLRIFF
jgi:hypothetical protein